MIDLSCECGHVDTAPESLAGGMWTCPQCDRQIQLACAEALPEGAGQGDFDAYLMITEGPDRVSQKILLGGVASIEIGKGDDRNVRLSGHHVSRHHCALNRVDFGPSRWELEDRGSTNGTSIGDSKITRQELKPGDVIRIGEYELQFDLAAPVMQESAAGAAMSSAATLPPPPPPPMPTAKILPAKSKKPMPGRPTLAYQTQETATEGPKLLGDCDINWVMKLRNASTIMVYTIIVGWISWRVRFVPYAPEVLDMASYVMSMVAAWLLTSPEPEAPGRWGVVRWPLRLVAVGTCAGAILAGIGAIAENEKLAALGLLMLFCQLPQTALFLFYLNRLSARLPNPGLGFLCILLMIATPIFMGMGLWAAYEAVTGTGGLGLGLLALLGLGLCRLGYIGTLIWFNKSFS